MPTKYRKAQLARDQARQSVGQIQAEMKALKKEYKQELAKLQAENEHLLEEIAKMNTWVVASWGWDEVREKLEEH